MNKEYVDLDKIALQIAERIRDEATQQDRIPFLTGDLRKSIQAELGDCYGEATVGSNLNYARAVHDGRPALTIRPNVVKNPPFGRRKHRDKHRARLKFQVGGKTVFAKSVHQPARKGRPFLREAVARVNNKGYDFLDRFLLERAGDVLAKEIKAGIKFEVVL